MLATMEETFPSFFFNLLTAGSDYFYTIRHYSELRNFNMQLWAILLD